MTDDKDARLEYRARHRVALLGLSPHDPEYANAINLARNQKASDMAELMQASPALIERLHHDGR